MIRVENLSYGFPQKELFQNVSFTLEAGAHCAFIGSNGTGKTTLVDMIMHEDKYLYDGKIHRDSECRIGYVSQFSKEDKNREITVFEYLSEVFVKNQEETALICSQMAEAEDTEVIFEKYQALLDAFLSMDGEHYESNIKKQLNTVGMSGREQTLLSQLSGGEYKLLQVMKEMLIQPNLLIMDEPDVFLDFKNLNGLCKLINGHKGTILVITHNRYLLNHCFNKILHLENTDIQEFDGSYIEYNYALLQKKIELQEQAKKDKDEIARNEAMVDRMRTLATNASIAALGRTLHARETHLERLRARQIKEPFLALKMPDIRLPEIESNPEEVILSVWNYEVAFDELLLSDVCFELHGNEKVAIVGANGTGKTTLLRDIYKNRHPSITLGENVKVEFLSQVYDDSEKTTLSGGEQNLKQIERICASDANLLLLDEPTSHLDTYTQVALEKAISRYQGAVLMVSHDFYNIVDCADYILYVDDKSVRRMRIRSFRKMIYENHFNKEYLETEQKKKELEMRIETALQNADVGLAKELCEQLGEVVEKLVVR